MLDHKIIANARSGPTLATINGWIYPAVDPKGFNVIIFGDSKSGAYHSIRNPCLRFSFHHRAKTTLETQVINDKRDQDRAKKLPNSTQINEQERKTVALWCGAHEIKQQLETASVIHLDSPQVGESRILYQDYINRFAKPGTIIVIPNAQCLDFLSSFRKDLHVVAMPIFEALVSQKDHTHFTLCAEKSDNYVFEVKPGDLEAARPYLEKILPGKIIPLNDSLLCLVNGGNPAYHPLILFEHFRASLQSPTMPYPTLGDVATALKNKQTLRPKEGVQLFYNHATEETAKKIVQMGKELEIVLKELQSRFTSSTPRKTAVHPYWTQPGIFMTQLYRHILGSPDLSRSLSDTELEAHTTKWLKSAAIYGHTLIPLEKNGSFALKHRFIEEDMAILLRNVILADFTPEKLKEVLPLHFELLKCYESIIGVPFIQDSQWSRGAYQLVFGLPYYPVDLFMKMSQNLDQSKLTAKL